MEFLNIKDPSRRKEIIQDYINTRNVIRTRNENNKENNLIKERALEAKVRPIVEATEKLPEKISDALLKNNLVNPFQDEPFHKSAFDYYMSSGMNKVRDNYFRIYENDGRLKLGDTDVIIDGNNNIIIKGKKFKSTQGLWDLIMLNSPKQYTAHDMDQYRKINDLTNLRYNPRPTARASHKKTNKFKFLNDKLDANPFRHAPLDYDDHSSDSSIGWEGLGISPIILPSDIKSLEARLQLVCAERAAGNVRATTGEIVAILDEMLRQNHITRPEYNVVCEKLGC